MTMMQPLSYSSNFRARFGVNFSVLLLFFYYYSFIDSIDNGGFKSFVFIIFVLQSLGTIYITPFWATIAFLYLQYYYRYDKLRQLQQVSLWRSVNRYHLLKHCSLRCNGSFCQRKFNLQIHFQFCFTVTLKWQNLVAKKNSCISVPQQRVNLKKIEFLIQK